MTQTVLLGFDDQGDPIEYRKLSARLPEFLAAFPPQDGYQIKIDFLDPIEAKPGLSELYKSAVAAGQKPENLGLPPVAGHTMIFRARLIDAEGWELSSGSALIHIQSYKDWEKGETAARQRLLAATGYGGDMLDVDEARDQVDQGLQPQAPAAATNQTRPKPTLKAVPKAEPSPENVTSGTEGNDSQRQEAQVLESSISVESPTPDHSAPQPAPSKFATDKKNEGIPDSVMRQIEHQAKLKNVTPAEVSTKAEAKAELKRLISM